MRKLNKAQNLIEYAVVVAVVAAAFVAMRVYFVRSVQDKYRQSADVFGEGSQYAPGSTQSTSLDGADFHVNETVATVDICDMVYAQIATYNRALTGYNTTSGTHIMGINELLANLSLTGSNLTVLSNNSGMADLEVPIVTNSSSGATTVVDATNMTGNFNDGMNNDTVAVNNSTSSLVARRQFILQEIANITAHNPQCF